MTSIIKPTLKEFNLRIEDDMVLVFYNGEYLTSMSWEVAHKLGTAFRMAANRAEEYHKALDIVRDNAILIRSGVPIGLSDNPVIKHESGKMAAWDTQLRRYIPPGKMGGIQSKGVVGTPRLWDTPQYLRYKEITNGKKR